jgi:hypothetical protein
MISCVEGHKIDYVEALYKDLSGTQTYYANRGLHFVMFDDKERLMEKIILVLMRKNTKKAFNFVHIKTIL